MTAAASLRYARFILAAILLRTALLPGQPGASVPPSTRPLPGCTTFYAYDGEAALAGNNEDFINPLTYIWFIPASPGHYGRVYFGYDDFVPQGGLNDQGVFFDGEGLPYKAAPVMSQKPGLPGGDLVLVDEILSRSAGVQDVIDIGSRWKNVGGEYSQNMFGDRHGDSVIIDGDTVLRKQGPFQIATNFRLVDNPNAPWPEGEERYGLVTRLLSQDDHYSVDLFRRVLDAAHQEGSSPTLYSQVYELNTGIIHVYQFHNFEQEVVFNLAAELAKGPHIVKISSLFSPDEALSVWSDEQIQQWKAGYEPLIDQRIQPGSQNWMSGEYDVPQGPDTGPVKIYTRKDQLYLQRPNQLPIELYPAGPDEVFHHFLNGFDLYFTFHRNSSGQVSGARGSFSFAPYNISLPYDLAPSERVAHNTAPWLAAAGMSILLILLGSVLVVRRRRKGIGEAR